MSESDEWGDKWGREGGSGRKKTRKDGGEGREKGRREGPKRKDNYERKRKTQDEGKRMAEKWAVIYVWLQLERGVYRMRGRVE